MYSISMKSFGQGMLAATALAALSLVSCRSMHASDEPVKSVAEADYTIRVDRANNGAATMADEADRSTSTDARRTLAFEMVGLSSAAQDATPEQRAAATQAAIIDAFAKALIEARASRGQSTADFTARIGPRMKFTHRTLDSGCEIQISLLYRGIESLFVVRNGVLQHPPQDLAVIRRLFEETNGEFSLLATDASSANGVAIAKVGCYLPAGFDSRITGDLTGEKVQTP